MSSGIQCKKSKVKKLKSRQVPTSRQSTIHHYFGGKLVPYQSTVTQFFKSKSKEVKEDPNQSERVEPFTSEETENEINTNQGSPPDHQFDSEHKTEQGKREKLDYCGLSGNVLDEKLSINNEEMKTSIMPLPSLDQISSLLKQSSSTKQLSLKIRKRKHRTDEKPSEKCLKSSDIISSSSTKKMMKIESTCSTNSELTSEDLEILAGYTNVKPTPKQPRLSELDDHFYKAKQTQEEASGARNLETLKKSSDYFLNKRVLVKTHASLPDSPSFSPKKSNPKYFSPLLERNTSYNLSKETGSLVMDNSMSLFSSPDQEKDGGIKEVSSCSPLSKESAKRVLFPLNREGQLGPSSPCTLDRMPEAIPNQDVNEEYGFEGDLNLSYLLDQSDLMSKLDVPSRSSSSRLNRFLVLEKVSQMSTDCSSEMINSIRPKPEVVLRLFDEKTNSERICHLRDDWLATDVEPGDTVQVNADYDSTKCCYTVDNTHHGNSIVINPDYLISGTSVANSITCVRRAVLSDKFKGQKLCSEAMTIGQMLHEVFQRVLLKKQEIGSSLSGDKLVGVVREELENVLLSVKSLEQLFSLSMSELAARQILGEQVPAIVDWCDKYMHREPVRGKGEVDFKRADISYQGTSCIAITDVLDIEENIWSPRYGLKGKVDVSVAMKELSISDSKTVSSSSAQDSGPGSVGISRLPLELKTGKMFRKQGTIEHRAQVSLYTLMLEERYQMKSPRGGLLFYLKGGHMHGLPALPHEMRGLINARNHLSRFQGTAGDSLSMPGLLKDKHTCKYCPCLKECMLYHSTVERGDKASSGLQELYDQQVSHLSPSHLAFFTKWYSLIAEEEKVSKAREGLPLWLSDHKDREEKGSCYANLLAKPATASPMTRQIQTFYKHTSSSASEDSLLSINDRVVISRQDGSGWAVTLGSIIKPLSANEVKVLVDKPVPSDDSTLYRVDMISSYGGGTMAGCLTDFCSSDSESDYHLRELIIDLSPPKFVQVSSSQTLSNSPPDIDQLLSELNSSQRDAIVKVMSARDYVMILGMPGTGKTTTIACLVRLLVTRGNSVLLTSYTHSAVDNILLKLLKNGVDFLRLGSPSRVHPAIQMSTPAHLCKGLKTVRDLERIYLNASVVACTCLGINHALFTRRAFDVCIVDEATQITLPVSLGPLRHAGMFVLVGDHYQLPPLVQSQQAREGGLDLSLFRYLSEHHPSALVSLNQQYRMNREIMNLSNRLIYNNQLKCGSEEVASARLYLPHLDLHPIMEPGCSTCEMVPVTSWLREAVDPQNPVLFVNTDRCNRGVESVIGDHLGNLFEVDVVGRIIETLLKMGLPSDKVGVVTPLRYQQGLIQQKLQLVMSSSTGGPGLDGNTVLSQNGVPKVNRVEVNTIDRYQGRDKECIVISFVRSNSKGNVGSLLKDWHRVNVALTRAKHKLLLVGSYTTLQRTPLLKSLLEMVDWHKWLVHVTEADL